MQIADIVHQVAVIPVVIFERIEYVLPLAKTLIDADLPIIEVALRSGCATEAIRLIKSEFPNLTVGASTIIDRKTVASAVTAGADFLVTPGTTISLLEILQDVPIPVLPGVVSPSEAMFLQSCGYQYLKLFPAVAAGGIGMLKALYGPLPELMFCPTGGIQPSTAKEYLLQPNVACVGGSWVAPPELIRQGQWQQIADLARQASQLKLSI